MGKNMVRHFTARFCKSNDPKCLFTYKKEFTEPDACRKLHKLQDVSCNGLGDMTEEQCRALEEFAFRVFVPAEDIDPQKDTWTLNYVLYCSDNDYENEPHREVQHMVKTAYFKVRLCEYGSDDGLIWAEDDAYYGAKPFSNEFNYPIATCIQERIEEFRKLGSHETGEALSEKERKDVHDYCWGRYTRDLLDAGYEPEDMPGENHTEYHLEATDAVEITEAEYKELRRKI